MKERSETPHPNQRSPRATSAPRAYEPPRLRKYGSLAELTRSGTGTVMEMGMGPNNKFM